MERRPFVPQNAGLPENKGIAKKNLPERLSPDIISDASSVGELDVIQQMAIYDRQFVLCHGLRE